MTKLTLSILDMHCSACVMRLEGIEDDLPGISTIRASYQRQTLVVEFDETRVTESQIRQAVLDKGYTIQPG